MARISYVLPHQIEDDEMRAYMEEAIRNGKPGPENLAIRAHVPATFRTFMTHRKGMKEEGVLPPEMREVLRVRIATSIGCPY